MRIPPFLALAALALALAWPASAPAATVPPEFIGMTAENPLTGSPGYRARALATGASIGVGTVRAAMAWNQVENPPGTYRFGVYDELVGQAARNGLRVLPFVWAPPSAYVDRPPGASSSDMYPPRDNNDYANFLAVLIARYGPSGSFWAQNPSIPRIPIRAWQVWNEPHLPFFWGGRSDPAQYTQLLRVAAARIRLADPGASVVSAGISNSSLPGAIPLNTFYQRLYDAGAKGSFDLAAVHPYAPEVGESMGLVDGVRAIMDARGDNAGMWVTETGWASGGAEHRFNVGEAEQATRLTELFRRLAEQRNRLKLRGFVDFNWRDRSAIASWDHHTGLLRLDESPKPAFEAFRRMAFSLLPTPPLLRPGALPFATSVASQARDFAGIEGSDLLRADAVRRDDALQARAGLGIGTLRVGFDGRRLQKGRRQRLVRHDALVLAAAARGLRVAPVLTRASGGFAAALARRYGPGGTLWEEHPHVVSTPVRLWQVDPRSGRRSLSAGRFKRLLRSVRGRIRTQDRRATVAAGPMALGSGGRRSLRLMRSLYRARAGHLVDAISVSSSARSSRGLVRALRSMRRLMNRSGGRRDKIVLSSYGWASAGRQRRYNLGRRGQARTVLRATRDLIRRRRSLGLTGAFYAVWRDSAGGRRRSWTAYRGLADRRGRLKPAYSALRSGFTGLR